MFVEVIIGLFLLIASIIDIKTREVPNFLSYGLIVFVAFNVVLSAFATNDFSIDYASILYAIIGLVVAGIIGYALYRLGQWGGGDVKIIFSLGLFYGLRIEFVPKLLIFLIATFLFGGVSGIIYSVYVSLKHWKTFKKNASKLLRKKEVHFLRRIITFSMIIILVITMFIPSKVMLMVLGIGFMFWLGFFLWILIKSVEDIIMIKEREVSKLVEGDWLLKTLKAKGLTVKPREIGMTKEDLAKVKKMGLKKVMIREGLPFVPSFFVGYILTFYSYLWSPFQ